MKAFFLSELFMKIDICSLALSPSAANWMYAQKLVMRNSNTKQTESMHYKRGNFLEKDSHATITHYCTPLWTIALPDLLDNIAPKDLTNIYLSQIKNLPVNFLTNAKAANIISVFLNKVREQISFYTAFGHMFYDFYDYELLIARAQSTYLDDMNSYPTGGRSHNPINSETIVYRATFNEVEINFFKKILTGCFDKYIITPIIDNPDTLPALVVRTLRLNMCNTLAIEIIVSKLIVFLNACGQLNRVIAFSAQDLERLLQKTCLLHKTDLERAVNEKLVHIFAKGEYDDHLKVDKYTQARPTDPKKHKIKLFESVNKSPLSKLQIAAAKCTAIVNVKYTLEVNEAINELKECNNTLKIKLQALQTINTKIIFGFAAIIAGTYLSIISVPFILVVLAGIATATYYIKARKQAEFEYRTALETSVNCLQRTQCRGSRDHNNIKETLVTLTSLMSKEQLEITVSKTNEMCSSTGVRP